MVLDGKVAQNHHLVQLYASMQIWLLKQLVSNRRSRLLMKYRQRSVTEVAGVQMVAIVEYRYRGKRKRGQKP